VIGRAAVSVLHDLLGLLSIIPGAAEFWRAVLAWWAEPLGQRIWEIVKILFSLLGLWEFSKYAGLAHPQITLGNFELRIEGMATSPWEQSILDLVDPTQVGGSSHQLLACWWRDEGLGRVGTDNGLDGRRISPFANVGRP
jgi:hypothetical protein